MAHVFDTENNVPVIERKKFGKMMIGQFFIWGTKVYRVRSFNQGVGNNNAACPLHMDGTTLPEERNTVIQDDVLVDVVRRSALVEAGLLSS